MAIGLTLLMATGSHAQPYEAKKYADEPTVFTYEAVKELLHQSYTVTDRAVINAMAQAQALGDPNTIEAIIIDSFIDPSLLNAESVTPPVAPFGILDVYIDNVIDRGTGYCYWDNYIAHIFEGPGSVSQTFTKSDTCALTGEVGMNFLQIVQAKFSVTINQTATQSTTYSVNIPAGKKIELRILTNYQRRDYTVYMKIGDTVSNMGSDAIHTAVGLYFQQIVRN